MLVIKLCLVKNKTNNEQHDRVAVSTLDQRDWWNLLNNLHELIYSICYGNLGEVDVFYICQNYLMHLRDWCSHATTKDIIKVFRVIQTLEWSPPDLLNGNVLLLSQGPMLSPLHVGSLRVFLDWPLIDLLLSVSDENGSVYPPGS